MFLQNPSRLLTMIGSMIHWKEGKRVTSALLSIRFGNICRCNLLRSLLIHPVATKPTLLPWSGKLGGLLFGLSGMRVGGRTSVGGGGGGRARSVTVTTPQANGFEEIDGIGCALFVFEIKGNSATSCRLAASPKVLIDDGGSMPEGVEEPQIIRWKRPCGNEVSDRPLEIEDLEILELMKLP